MLISDADVWGHGKADVRIDAERIAAIGDLPAEAGETVIDAAGGALLPGLHDHHLHLAGLAVREASVWCGPPDIDDEGGLAQRLSAPGTGWIRAIGYHESVLGELPDAAGLDRFVLDRPLRMQHRSGRMWLLNSCALENLLSDAEPPPGLERDAGGFTGRLFDEDSWLRAALGSKPPDFAEISATLASHGITGITDMSPGNDPEIAKHFTAQVESGVVTQHCTLAGALSLADALPGPWTLGPVKLHLHEAALPEFADAVRFIEDAHEQQRPIAIHCVSEIELVFALAALEEAEATRGNRIEHASVASPGLVERIAELGLAVCSQPHFIFERGDRYLIDVETRHLGDLYRLRSFLDAAIPLAGGSDAPFGSADPWQAMAAAVSRSTSGGSIIGKEEALTAEEALALYLADPLDLSRQRRVEPGGRADLCLLRKPWAEAKTRLESVNVAATFISGRLIHDCVDQPPGQSLAGG